MITKTISLSLGQSPFSPRRFSIHEAVSSLFTVSIWARSEDDSIPSESVIGKPAGFHIQSGYAHVKSGGSRLWTGICAHFEQLKAVVPLPGQTPLHTYFIRIVPNFWLLTQRSNYRVFQHESIPDIIKKILKESKIEADWKIQDGNYPKLNYKVQYGESDFAFINRLIEEAGIVFSFPDPKGEGAKLTFCDALEANAPRAPILFTDNPNQQAELELIKHVRLSQEVRPGAFSIRDYDFRKPAFDLLGQAPKAEGNEARYEQYRYEPGSFLVEGAKGGDTPAADDKGTARHEQSYGKSKAERMLLAERMGKLSINFDTNVMDVFPGAVFSMLGHPNTMLAEGKGMLVTQFSIEGTHGGEWSMSGRAVFADTPYRQPLRTPKPKAFSVQSATVVGPKGQEIHTDEFGRVRVQFPWDREGKHDENASCWVRVSQGWAGTGFGMIVLPRIGQEVLIGFLEGDPEQPIVMGRVFNRTQPVPYTLPANKTISTWKSNSSLGNEGYNELKFEDKKGDELLYEQAEKNRRTLVKHNETITVLRHRSKTVGMNETDTTGVNRIEVTGINRSEQTGANRMTAIGGTRRKLIKKNETERTQGNRQLYVGKDEDIRLKKKKRELIEQDVHLVVKGNRSERIDKNQSMMVIENRQEKVLGRYALQTGKELYLRTAEVMVGEAGQDVTIRGPGGFLRIDATGVTIKGTIVYINEGGKKAGKGTEPKTEEPEEPGEDEETGGAVRGEEDRLADADGTGKGSFSVAEVKKIIAKTNPEMLKAICEGKVNIIAFDAAYDKWEYNDGRIKENKIGLLGNTRKNEKEIRLSSQLSNEEAATTLFHEMQHMLAPPAFTKEAYLKEEIDARVATEEFAIAQGMPPTSKGYRTEDGKVNREAIEIEIKGSSHYNPTDRKRISRRYEGEKPTAGWCPP